MNVLDIAISLLCMKIGEKKNGVPLPSQGSHEDGMGATGSGSSATTNRRSIGRPADSMSWSEQDVRLAQKTQVDPCIKVGAQL